MILQKYIADAGYCSRRQAEQLIREGRVTVNGRPAELGMRAEAGDEVRVDGEKLELAKERIYIILNKPAGYTCTRAEFPGERNVFALLRDAPGKDGLRIAGRLDKNSRGLLLLTNDGEMAERLTHPRYGHEKEYIARLAPPRYAWRFDPPKICRRLGETGVDIGDDDGVAKAKAIEYLGKAQFRLILTEGKKRQIRRMFAALDLEVSDLVRVRMGKITLGDLPEGKWRKINI